MFTLLFIAMCISMVVAFLLIRRLQEKPWTQIGVIEASQDNLTSSAPKVGLWVFLGGRVLEAVYVIASLRKRTVEQQHRHIAAAEAMQQHDLLGARIVCRQDGSNPD